MIPDTGLACCHALERERQSHQNSSSTAASLSVELLQERPIPQPAAACRDCVRRAALQTASHHANRALIWQQGPVHLVQGTTTEQQPVKQQAGG